MSKTFAALLLVAGITAACAPQEPQVSVTNPGAVTIEPSYTGKFGN